MVHARHIDPRKGVRQAPPVVGEEERAGEDRVAAELVSAADDVPGRNSRKSWLVDRVVAPAVGVFEELAQIVEVPGGTETIPPRQTPGWVWFARRACRNRYSVVVDCESGRDLYMCIKGAYQ